MTNDRWFERLAETTGPLQQDRATAKLKSTVYSVLVSRMAETGPLLDLPTTKARGGHLCIFESALSLLPLGADVHSMNPCRICHARVLAERMPRAPIFWPGCPYSSFHND
jgi:hypothetical protein